MSPLAALPGNGVDQLPTNEFLFVCEASGRLHSVISHCSQQTHLLMMLSKTFTAEVKLFSIPDDRKVKVS